MEEPFPGPHRLRVFLGLTGQERKHGACSAIPEVARFHGGGPKQGSTGQSVPPLHTNNPYRHTKTQKKAKLFRRNGTHITS